MIAEKRRSTLAAMAVVLASLLFSLANPAGGVDGANRSKSTENKGFPIIAYVPDYRIDSLDSLAGGLVTDLIFFSIEPKANGGIDSRRLRAESLRKLHAIRTMHHTRLLVALGGWGRSKNFAVMSSDPKTRGRFVDQLTRYCLENKLDGADFDWEHPANKAENDGYAALLTEVKLAFAPKRLLVSVTLAGWQDPGPAAYRAVARLQIMSYDHDGPRHSTFANARADVDKFLARGVAREKIYLGLPFYGRGMKDRKLVMTYAQIARRFQPGPETDEVAGVYFNGINTLQEKTRYARKTGLGGVMIWEIGQDTRDFTLLRAIRKSAEVK